MTDHLHARSVLTGRTTNWPLVVITAVLVIPLLVMAMPSGNGYAQPTFLAPLGITALVVAVNIVMLSSLRTTAGPHGLTVHFGVFGWPRFRYRLDDIRCVELTRVSVPQTVGGVWWTPSRGLVLALRYGPAVKLHLASGRLITISVENATGVVATLAAAGCPTA